jgi:hemolysin III
MKGDFMVTQTSEWDTGYYSMNEEILNAVSHGFGAILSIVGTMILIGYSLLLRDEVRVFSSTIFGISAILLYTSSTLYHALTVERAKQVFRILDHCSIFLLIAGSYTPISLITIGGASGTALCVGIWCVAAVGIVFNIIGFKKILKFSALLYLAMSWAFLFAFGPVLRNMPFNGVMLLIGGGLIYSIVVIFYVMKRRRYAHSIWHLFVLGGSLLYYFCILFYVLPLK